MERNRGEDVHFRKSYLRSGGWREGVLVPLLTAIFCNGMQSQTSGKRRCGVIAEGLQYNDCSKADSQRKKLYGTSKVPE